MLEFFNFSFSSCFVFANVGFILLAFFIIFAFIFLYFFSHLLVFFYFFILLFLIFIKMFADIESKIIVEKDKKITSFV